MIKYHAECWFPCMVHILETEPDENIKSYCLKLREGNPESNLASNRKGWQSHSFEGGDINEKLYELFEHSLSTVIKGKISIYNYWININGKGAYNVEHDHPQAHLSGVYYVRCPKNSGVIVFENPFSFKAFDELSSYNEGFVQRNAQHKAIYVQPKDGLLLIFPAHLRHQVLENNSDEERISISFNLHVSP